MIKTIGSDQSPETVVRGPMWDEVFSWIFGCVFGPHFCWGPTKKCREDVKFWEDWHTSPVSSLTVNGSYQLIHLWMGIVAHL